MGTMRVRQNFYQEYTAGLRPIYSSTYYLTSAGASSSADDVYGNRITLPADRRSKVVSISNDDTSSNLFLYFGSAALTSLAGTFPSAPVGVVTIFPQETKDINIESNKFTFGAPSGQVVNCRFLILYDYS